MDFLGMLFESFVPSMNKAENIVSLLQLVYSMHRKYYERELKNLHFEEMTIQAINNHEARLKYEKELAAEGMRIQLQNHSIELILDLITQSRDSERDMFDQANHQVQTLMLATTIMLAALTSVQIQGVLADEATVYVKLFYSLFTVLSLISLVSCEVILYVTRKKSSGFMYKQSKKLFSLIRDVQQLAESNRERSEPNPKEENNFDILLEKLCHNNNKIKTMRVELSRIIDDMKIGESIDENFDLFWRENCENRVRVGIALYYIGTICFITSTVIFMYNFYLYSHASTIGAMVSVFILLFTVLNLIMVVQVIRKKKTDNTNDRLN